MTQELTLLISEKPTLVQLALVNMSAGSSREEAERLVLREIANIENHILINPELSKCSPESFVYAIKEAINNNITLSPAAALAYLIPGQVTRGIDPATNKDIKKWIVNFKPTANGKLSIARQAGRIFDNVRPEIIYDESGKVNKVTVSFLVPSINTETLKPCGRWEKISFDGTHFKKWHQKCLEKNSGKGDYNYKSWNGGIDPEFAGTKAIIHGLGKLGTNMNEIKRNVSVALDFKGVSAKAAFAEANEENFTEDISHKELESNTRGGDISTRNVDDKVKTQVLIEKINPNEM